MVLTISTCVSYYGPFFFSSFLLLFSSSRDHENHTRIHLSQHSKTQIWERTGDNKEDILPASKSASLEE